MQSQPASAEATSVSILSPVFVPSWTVQQTPPRSGELVDEFSQAQVPGEGGRHEQAGIGHQGQVVEGIGYGRGGSWSIYWVLLAMGSRFCR